MSDTIQLGPVEANVIGWGPDYYRRKQEPTEPYYVENLNFDETVQKEFPGRDFDVEQYLVNQAIRRGQDPKRPFQKTLRGLDWSQGSDKVRTEYWDPEGVARGPHRELGHYNEGNGFFGTTEPTIRMFADPAPHTHEFSHHLYNFKDNPPDPRRMVDIPEPYNTVRNADDYATGWLSTPLEIQAEASYAKRKYAHDVVGSRKDAQSPYIKSRDPDYGGRLSRYAYKKDYGVEPFDKNHPAVKEDKPIPDEIIDDMFESWMQEDRKGWGESYQNRPEEFPVELFKEALRLGQNNQKPAGLFTGRGPQNA